MAVVGGSGAAKSATVADAVAGKYADQKIQVTGNVVENSYATNDNVLTFAIYDKDGNPAEQLNVRYEGGVSATFGNDVTAICTGKIAGDGVLHATELVTKCPSKYENASSALSVSPSARVRRPDRRQAGEGFRHRARRVPSRLPVRATASCWQTPTPRKTLPVAFDGALSDEIAEGGSLVITGTLVGRWQRSRPPMWRLRVRKRFLICRLSALLGLLVAFAGVAVSVLCLLTGAILGRKRESSLGETLTWGGHVAPPS